MYFLGGLRVFMALKALPAMMHCHKIGVFEGHAHPNSPKNYIRLLGGLSPIHSMRRRGAKGLVWGARGPFPPAAAMVVAVVMPVVFCDKATERQNKNTKISCLLPKSLFITFIIRHTSR